MRLLIKSATLGAALFGLGTVSLPVFAGGGGTYIAVGDSVAYGYMNSTLTPPGGSGYSGYAELYMAYLSQQAGTPVTLINLGIVGETTQSLLTNSSGNASLNSNYSLSDPQSQLDLLTTDLNPSVTHITVQIGANDVLGLAANLAFASASPTVQQSLLMTTLAQVQSNYDVLLTQIGQDAPAADVQVLDYYNSYAALPPSTAAQPYNDYLRTISGPLIGGLNTVIAQEAALHHDSFVDLAGPFAGQESALTRSNEEVDFDGVPLPNDHPTAAGYAVIAEQLEAAPVPESSTACSCGLLLLLGAGSFAAARRGTRRAKKIA